MRDQESSYLALESEGEGEDALNDLQGHSIRYLIAVGPHKGRQAFKWQTLPPLTGDRRVARYITRPPVAIERISLTPEGNIRYALKTPYRGVGAIAAFSILQTHQTYGRLDILHNNAGGSDHDRDLNAADITDDAWDETWNMGSTRWGCRYALPLMIAGGGDQSSTPFHV